MPCLFAPLPAHALEPDWAVTQYRVDSWTQRQGLPQETVLAIVQDRSGHLWLGTQEGLARFDGVAFESYSVANQPEIGHNFISHLLEDKAGRLWFGTDNGTLGFVQAGKFSALRGGAEFRGRIVGLATQGDELLVAFQQAGLFRVVGQQWVPVPLSAQPDGGAPLLGVLARGPSGLWLGGRGGIYHQQGGDWSFLAVPASRGRLVTALAEHEDGTLWMSCGDEDVLAVRLEGGAAVSASEPARLPGAVRGLLVDSAGVLWVANETGLWRWRVKAAGAVLERVPGGPVGIVDIVREGSDGGLWVGARNEGLFRLRSDEALPFGVPEGLPSDSTWNVLETRGGELLASTDGGLVRLRAGKVEPVISPLFPTSDTISMLESRDGALWLGTFRHGLFRREPRSSSGVETWAEVDLNGSLPPSPITVVFEDLRGAIWVGSRDGLARRREGRFERVPLVEGPVQPYVSAMLEDEAGTVWVTTASAGLVSFADSTTQRFGLADGLPSLNLNSLALDAKGRLWIATNDRGLALFSNGRFSAVGTAASLPFAVILWLMVDRSDHLWLTTGHGLVRAATDDLAKLAAGELSHVPVRVLGEGDGLRSVDFAATGQPAGWATADGRLWFPSDGGLVMVDPARLAEPRPPHAEIRRLRSSAGDFQIGPELGDFDLPPNQREIEIRYSAPTFDEPEGTQFRYRLLGYDESWREVGILRSALYTNLPPRKYRFEVAAQHQDGGKFGPVVAIELALAPTLAQSWPFRIVVTLLAASLAVAAVRWRGRRLYELVARRTAELSRANQDLEAAVEREHVARSLAEAARAEAERAASAKSDFLAAVSHELRTPLNAILGLSDLMLETPLDDRQREWGKLVQKSGEDLLGMVDELLDLARIEHDRLDLAARPFDLAQCLEAAVSMARMSAELKGLTVRFSFRPLELREVVGDERRVRQVANNLLANAVKFTEQGEIAVAARVVPEGEGLGLQLEVRDSGVGIPDDLKAAIFQPFVQAEAPLTRRYGGVGLGLAIATRICAAMGGKIDVESSPGRGSVFRARMVLARAEALPHAVRAAPAAEPKSPNEAIAFAILTVEDDEVNRQVARAILKSLGQECEFANDGEQALEAVASRPFDVVLLDLQLPGIDGFEVARRIRAGAALGRPKIFALTASAMRRERDRSRLVGMDGFLSKPLRPADLAALLEALARERQSPARLQPP